MKKLNAYQKIQKGKKEMEAWIIKRIKNEGSFYPVIGGKRIWNALERLVEKSKIKLYKVNKFSRAYKLNRIKQ